MTHSRLEQLIRAAREQRGFNIKDFPPDTAFVFRAQNNTYRVAIIDPEHRVIALSSTRLGYKQPELYVLQGPVETVVDLSSVQLKKGCVEIGKCLRFISPTTGHTETTTQIRRFRFAKTPCIARRLTQKAITRSLNLLEKKPENKTLFA